MASPSAVNMFSTPVRLWFVRGLSHLVRLPGFLAGFFQPVPQASDLELPSLSLCDCRGVGLGITSAMRAETTVRCFSSGGLSVVVVSVSLGFNSPLYCLWWRGKILRYQVAPPLPAFPDALCPLKMHGQFTNIDGSSLFPFLSFFFFFPFFPPPLPLPTACSWQFSTSIYCKMQPWEYKLLNGCYDGSLNGSHSLLHHLQSPW